MISLLGCTYALVPSAHAQPIGRGAYSANPDGVVLYGVGTAHGLGMAMDGVEGQARAGWTSDRILSLFYPGTTTGRASGTIRVGLAEGSKQSFVLPGGGSVADGGQTLRTLAPGTRLTVASSDGRAVLELKPSSSTPSPKPSPSPTAEPDDAFPIRASSPGNPLESPPPAPTQPPATPPPILPPTDAPDPEPTPTTPPQRRERGGGDASGALRIVPAGEPAVVTVEATGHRYRGVIEVQPSGGSLRVVNHVDLETYVAGIAEEKGAGWPLEGLKTLAVAARSLGAATMTWYHRSQANGYDICPTQNCQVYLGYDGEEALMKRAVEETSGQIREYKGRPILAMYHGNGGGQTESYRRVAQTKSDTHPYLRSIRYPYADPSTWRRELKFTEIAAALTARGVDVPQPIERLEILERGDSPRVIRLRVHGGPGRHRDLTGTTFMMALDLWSTWFEIGKRGTFTTVRPGGFPMSRLDQATDISGDVQSAGFLFVLAVAVLMLATATVLQATNARLMHGLHVAWPPLRPAPAPSPPGS